MDKNKVLGNIEVIGLACVVLSAALWIKWPDAASILMLCSSILMGAGRFLQAPFYQKYGKHDPRELTLRRLYHQRVWGFIALLLACAIMLTPAGFHFGLWVSPGSWILPFVFFAITEVYTAFRISAVEQD